MDWPELEPIIRFAKELIAQHPWIVPFAAVTVFAVLVILPLASILRRR